MQLNALNTNRDSNQLRTDFSPRQGAASWAPVPVPRAEQVHLPELNYDCVSCGKSCSGWKIELDRPAQKRLNYHPLTVAQRDQGVEPMQYPFVGQSDCGSCCYLSKDNLCGLHRDDGYEIKPRGCKAYPFNFVSTPDGIFVGLSFRCTAVRQNSGRPLKEEPARHDWVREMPMPEVGFEPIPMDESSVVSWEEYLKIEDSAVAALEAGKLQQWAAGLLGARWSIEDFGPAFIAFIEGRGLENTREVENCLKAGRPFESRRGFVIDPNLGHGDDEFERLMSRYLKQLLHSKFLLKGPHLKARVMLFATLPFLLRFYLSQATQVHGQVIGDAHHEMALDIVEMELATHRAQGAEFLKFFYNLAFAPAPSCQVPRNANGASVAVVEAGKDLALAG